MNIINIVFIIPGRGNSQTPVETEEDQEEDEEGIDQPDSLYCHETIEESDEVDGLLEFQRKIESDV